MASLTTLVLVYLFGGLTFLPLLLGLAIYFGTQAVQADETPDVLAGKAGVSGHDGAAYDDGLARPGDDTRTTEAVRRELAREKELRGGSGKKHRHDPADDFAASGYFAVYRKFVTAGVNTRPVEPSTVGPEPVAPPSPSVYQTFFRSMLNKKPSPEAVAISKAASPRPKNARNMFYVVLRHGYLILFDDDRQVDVRHVIKLADHDVGVYAGSDTIPEGELFIKRNAVRLAPKNRERVRAHNAPTPQPWFFYCENCSDKEDFYFALLRSQQGAPQPLAIDVRHLTALMERLHASEEAAETRWLNALVGRLFLGVAKTPDMLRFVEAKIATKLARMPRPGFVSSLAVQRVDVGESTPQITSPRLKSLSAEGECVVEADVRYAGRFEVDLAATMRISMPIGQQEVKTSLAVVLTHLEGHVLFKIKAPPSNRIWFAFRQMPKVEMEIRPIVMARQLTWPVVLSLIENKLKEAIADSIVLPFWDDTPFFRTDKKKWRGGLWDEANDEADETPPEGGEPQPMANADGPAPGVPEGPAPPDAAAVAAAAAGDGGAGGKSSGMARDGQDENVSPAVLRLRRLSKTHSSPATVGSTAAAADAGNDAGSRTTASSAKSTQSHKKRQSSGDDAGPFPSSSKRFSQTNAAFASPSEPTTGTDSLHAEAFIPPSSPPKDGKPGSAAAMAWLSSNARRHSRSSASSVDVDAAAGTPPSREGPRRNRSSRTVASLGTSVEGQDTEMPDDSLFDISDSEAGPPGTRSGRPTTVPASARDSSTSLCSSRTTTASGESGDTVPRAIRRKPVEASASATGTEGGSSTSTTDTNGTAGAGPAAATPPKRTAVLAAAVNDAAVSAKRWGINVLQQRRAAQAERRARTTTSGAPLDLSKPMGGGRPLPPVGEPLPLPHELAQAQRDGAAASGASAGSDASPKPQRIHRKPAPAPGTAAQHQQQHQQQQHQQQQQNNDPGHYRHRRRGSSQLLLNTATGFPQQDLLVVAAPVDDSESDGDNGGNDDNDESGVDRKTTTAVAEDTGAQEAASDAPPPTDKTSDSEETPEAKVDDPSSESADEPGKTDEVDEAEDDEDDAQWGELAESVMSAFLGGEDGGEEGKKNDTAVPTEPTNGDRDVGKTASGSPDETAAPEKQAANVPA